MAAAGNTEVTVIWFCVSVPVFIRAREEEGKGEGEEKGEEKRNTVLLK
jgi:hypothetical protein